MQKVNLNKRKAQLSKLAPLALLEKSGRVGFLKTKGEIRVPDNFNDLHCEEIEDLFNGKDLSAPKETRCEVHVDSNVQEKMK